MNDEVKTRELSMCRYRVCIVEGVQLLKSRG